MSNSQSNSEFVETAFTAEEVGNVESTQDHEVGAEACAFLEIGRNLSQGLTSMNSLLWRRGCS